MPLATISHVHHRWDSGSAYAAVLDGEEAGELQDGGELALEVSPGQHRLHFLNAYDRSHSLEFRAGERSDIRLL